MEHLRDVTYVGSILANYYVLSLLEQKKQVSAISHDLFYALFATVTGKGKKANKSIKKAFDSFKSKVPSFDPKRFKSQGFMPLISQVAKDYEENVRNHVTANLLAYENDAVPLCQAGKRRRRTVSQRYSITKTLLTEHTCKLLLAESNSDIDLPKPIKDNPDLIAHLEKVTKFLRTSIKQGNFVRLYRLLRLLGFFTNGVYL